MIKPKIKDKQRIGLAALFYVASATIIIGYYWLFKGYYWNFSLTYSKYAALSPWSVIVFAVSNLGIAAILVDFIRNTKGYKPIWYFVMYMMVFGLIGMSFCPDGLLNIGDTIHWTAYAHNVFAGITFTGMIIATLISLKRNWKNLKHNIPVSFYVVYSIAFMITFAMDVSYSVSYVLIWELLFLLVFYAVVGSTKTPDI